MELIEVHGGRNRGDDRKSSRVAVRNLQNTLTAHADTEKSNPRTFHTEPLAHPRDDLLKQPLLRGHLRMKLRGDHIKPPVFSSMRCDDSKPLFLKKLRKDRILVQHDLPVAVKKQHNSPDFC